MPRMIYSAAFAFLALCLLSGCAPSGVATTPSAVATTPCAQVSPSSNAASPGSEQDLDWPPADSCGAFLPVPDFFYLPFDVQGCGGTVSVMGGDPRTLEYRATVQDDGSTMVDYRGRYTVDVARDYGGGLDAFVDELDASGSGYDIYAQDGLTVTFSREGPSILAAVDAVEAQAFADAGFPAVFYFESGTVTERVVYTATDFTAVKSAEFTTNTAAKIHSVCYLLDPSNPGE